MILSEEVIEDARKQLEGKLGRNTNTSTNTLTIHEVLDFLFIEVFVNWC